MIVILMIMMVKTYNYCEVWVKIAILGPMGFNIHNFCYNWQWPTKCWHFFCGCLCGQCRSRFALVHIFGTVGRDFSTFHESPKFLVWNDLNVAILSSQSFPPHWDCLCSFEFEWSQFWKAAEPAAASILLSLDKAPVKAAFRARLSFRKCNFKFTDYQ